MIQFRLPWNDRWTVDLFDLGGLFVWSWCELGYDGLWYEYNFGFMLGLSYETDYSAEMRKPEVE